MFLLFLTLAFYDYIRPPFSSGFNVFHKYISQISVFNFFYKNEIEKKMITKTNSKKEKKRKGWGERVTRVPRKVEAQPQDLEGLLEVSMWN